MRLAYKNIKFILQMKYKTLHSQIKVKVYLTSASDCLFNENAMTILKAYQVL